MALSDLAAFLAGAGAVVALYAAVAVAIDRGWVRPRYRLQAATLLLAGLLARIAIDPELPQSTGLEDAGVAAAAAGPTLGDEVYYVCLPLIAVCILCVCLRAVEVVMRRGWVPVRVHERRGHLGRREYV
ncbi:hypothetical protein ACP70R_047556 [Stipagrostis hirtigluma subsp. patula]